jgi:hypothetical protein
MAAARSWLLVPLLLRAMVMQHTAILEYSTVDQFCAHA